MSEEELINYFQGKINNGNHKIFMETSNVEYKTIDAINCIKDLKQRIDKAVELIEKLRMEKWSIMGTDIMDLLSILQGKE